MQSLAASIFLFVFETRFFYVAQADLKLIVIAQASLCDPLDSAFPVLRSHS